jgi:hypothetical protein
MSGAITKIMIGPAADYLGDNAPPKKAGDIADIAEVRDPKSLSF